MENDDAHDEETLSSLQKAKSNEVSAHSSASQSTESVVYEQLQEEDERVDLHFWFDLAVVAETNQRGIRNLYVQCTLGGRHMEELLVKQIELVMVEGKEKKNQSVFYAH